VGIYERKTCPAKLIAGLLVVIIFNLPFLTVGILNLTSKGRVYYFMPATVEGEKIIFRNKEDNNI
jgi:hypothetical protein